MGIVITVGADDVKVCNDSASCYDRHMKKMWGTYAQFKALNLDEVDDCTLFYIKDWYYLTAEQKTDAGHQIVMFDEETKTWMKQGE